MRRRIAVLMVACGAALAGGPLAGYSGPDYAKLKALLPPAPDATLCYARTYDTRHLDQHPRQRVTEMVLSLRYVTLDLDHAILEATDDGGIEKRYFEYDFTLAAKTRDQPKTLYASGSCASAEAIGCGVECDGGGIEIEPVAGTDGAVLARLERIRMTLGCSDGPSVDLDGGLDDKVFKLSKVPRRLCEAVEADARKPAP